MAVRSKKGTPYEVGREVWVKAEITRVAPHPRLKEVTEITVKMPNGNRETMRLDEARLRPDDK